MKLLYENEDDFRVERRLGQTWYYCEILKSAITKYGLSENPNYDELERIVKRIDTYMNSSRYEGALEAPIYIESTYASDVYLIRTAILKLNRQILSKKEIQEYYHTQIERIEQATERSESLLRSS